MSIGGLVVVFSTSNLCMVSLGLNTYKTAEGLNLPQILTPNMRRGSEQKLKRQNFISFLGRVCFSERSWNDDQAALETD